MSEPHFDRIHMLHERGPGIRGLWAIKFILFISLYIMFNLGISLWLNEMYWSECHIFIKHKTYWNFTELLDCQSLFHKWFCHQIPTVVFYHITEIEMSTFWHKFCHWVHKNLSFQKLPIRPVTNISLTWQHNENMHDDILDQFISVS